MFKFMLKENDERLVKIGNPRTTEFTCGRTTLVPGCLKWLMHNKNTPLPIRLFELGDVVLKCNDKEVKVKNERRVCAIYTNKAAKLEKLHGLLDHIMIKLNVKGGIKS